MSSTVAPEDETGQPEAPQPAEPARPPAPCPDTSAGLAVLIALAQTLGTALAAHGQSAKLDLVGYLLLAVGGLMLVERHRIPKETLMLVATATVAYHVLHYPSGPTTYLALVCAVSAATKAGKHGEVWAISIVSYAVWSLLAGPTLSQALDLAGRAFAGLVVIEVAAASAGAVSEMMAEQRRASEERRRRQASEERLRIAQEVHDVLGHHLSLINVRAGVGLHLMDRQPDQARAALDAIKQASAEALREIRAVINTLYPAEEAAPLTPAPQLERLDELTSDAGLPLRTTVNGAPYPLPAEIDRAAYRIVQEALTNVRRHAGAGASASVVIEYQEAVPMREALVLVQIEDDGGATGPVDMTVSEGTGINGMRERAAALGGSLSAGPLPRGGWRVRASLPVPESAAAAVPAPADAPEDAQ